MDLQYIFLHQAECSTQALQVNVLHVMPVMSLWRQVALGLRTCFLGLNTWVLMTQCQTSWPPAVFNILSTLADDTQLHPSCDVCLQHCYLGGCPFSPHVLLTPDSGTRRTDSSSILINRQRWCQAHLISCEPCCQPVNCVCCWQHEGSVSRGW